MPPAVENYGSPISQGGVTRGSGWASASPTSVLFSPGGSSSGQNAGPSANVAFLDRVAPQVKHHARNLLNTMSKRPDVGRSASSVTWPTEARKFATWYRHQVLVGGGTELLDSPVRVLTNVISMIQERAPWSMAQTMFGVWPADVAARVVQCPEAEQWLSHPLLVAAVIWIVESDAPVFSGISVMEMPDQVSLMLEQVARAPLPVLGSSRLYLLMQRVDCERHTNAISLSELLKLCLLYTSPSPRD